MISLRIFEDIVLLSSIFQCYWEELGHCDSKPFVCDWIFTCPGIVFWNFMMRFCDISFVFLSIVLSTQNMLSVWDLIALWFWKKLLNYCIVDFLFPSIFSGLSFRTHIYILSFLLPSAPLSTPLFISFSLSFDFGSFCKGIMETNGAGGWWSPHWVLPTVPSLFSFSQVLCSAVLGSPRFIAFLIQHFHRVCSATLATH